MKIALIGYGGMGKYHLRKLRRTGLYQIAGIYDIDKDKLSDARRRGYKTYQSQDEMLADSSLDAVLIATPNDSHYQYVVDFANAGKHIFCEKPVALNSAELAEMIACANKNKVVFTVNQNRRYDRDYLIIKNIYNRCLMGSPYKIVSNVMGSHGISGDWRKEKSQGGGMIFDWGVHLVDQALQMIDKKVYSVYCNSQYVYGNEVEDGCFIVLKFENGVEYHINIETNAFVSLPRWLIYGLDGTAIIKNWLLQGKMVKVKTWFDNKNKGISAGNGFTKTMADRSKSTIIRHRLPRVKTDGLSLYKNFYKAIEGQQNQIVQHDELARVMKILETCFESAEKNQVIHTEI